MKREFPALYALASTSVATPLIVFCALFYMQDSIDQPASKVFSLGLSIFGMTVALSGVSFSMARTCEDPYTAKYAGEKFLHSAILLIQGLLVLYIRDTVMEIEWVKNWPGLVIILKGVTIFLIGTITAAAAWAWYFGYSELNQFLWENWRRRIDNINSAKAKATPPKDEAGVPR